MSEEPYAKVSSRPGEYEANLSLLDSGTYNCLFRPGGSVPGRRIDFMRELFRLYVLTALVIGLTALGAACSADKEAGSGSAGASRSDDIPAAVKAALPKAQITKRSEERRVGKGGEGGRA